MSSENELLKTNEFLRRRKLRLQQVREQSKDIAKKIRQRAEIEKYRHIVELDTKKEKEYLEQQEKLVAKLERKYRSGLHYFGASHKSASDVNELDTGNERADLSKLRGKAATDKLRQKKQKYLDDKRKILDRKLQARETANEISREKAVILPSKIKSATKLNVQNQNKDDQNINKFKDSGGDKKQCSQLPEEKVTQNDMSTQWDSQVLPTEWEPNVPKLSLNKGDGEIVDQGKDVKKQDLFALSDEMPSNLRGTSNITRQSADTNLFKPSSIISEYLQTRGMRLRESQPVSNKFSTDDLQKIKQTLLRTRAAKTEGTSLTNVCCVLDTPMVPVPAWQAEPNCHYCLNNLSHVISNKNELNKVVFKELHPNPVLRGCTPFRRNRICSRNCYKYSGKFSNVEKNSKQLNSTSTTLNKNNLVTVYNHSTRDARDIPRCEENKIVVRDLQTDNDAYSQALKESTTTLNVSNDQKKVQDMRHKVAVTKKKVEKEYEETMGFLKSLPKDNKPMKKAYMPEFRRNQQKIIHQRKMQSEYNKIEKECKKHCPILRSNENISYKNCNSPVDFVYDDEVMDSNNIMSDHQYSWIPVPESDHSLAVHKIPNTKETKTSHTVKFDDTNNYHEYRSRHKHTPPTKDKPNFENDNRKHIEAIIIDQNIKDQSTENSSCTSNSSSERDNSKNNNNLNETDRAIEDNDRIIIYRIVDSKKADKKKKSTLTKDVVTSVTSMEKEIRKSLQNQSDRQSDPALRNDTGRSFEQLSEGIYKTVKDKGDNVASLYYSDRCHKEEDENISNGGEAIDKTCGCRNVKTKKLLKTDVNKDLEADSKMCDDSIPQNRVTENNRDKCHKCGGSSSKQKEGQTANLEASASTSSFKTAEKPINSQTGGGHIKLVDNIPKEEGNFYIGASGFLKDDAYEVIIQLRKKDTCNKVDDKDKDQIKSKPMSPQVTERNGGEYKELIPEIVLHPKEGPSLLSPEITKEVQRTTVCKDKQIILEELTNGEEKVLDKLVTSNTIKTVSSIRPATSTHTQTSMYSSPTQRPVYFHMSSSTSTTYMSPPEMILPNILKHQYDLPHDQIYNRPLMTADVVQDIYEEQEPLYSSSFENKKCQCKHHSVVRNESKLNKKRRKSHKCKKNDQQDTLNAKMTRTKSRNENKFIGFSSTDVNHNKCERILSKKGNHNSKLNPIIKTYVNELLQLNKDSVKVINVATQHCSSVSTPGSSIVNISSNVDKKKILNEITPTISLEHFKDIFKQNKSKNNNVGKVKEGSSKVLYSFNLEHNISINRKRKSGCSKRSLHRHKVKSLNIPKNLKKYFNIDRHKMPALSSRPSTSSTSNLESNNIAKKFISKPRTQNVRSKSTPTPRPSNGYQLRRMKTTSDIQKAVVINPIKRETSYKIKDKNTKGIKNIDITRETSDKIKDKNIKSIKKFDFTRETSYKIKDKNTKSIKDIDSQLNSCQTNISSPKISVGLNVNCTKLKDAKIPADISTQTIDVMDCDERLMQLEDNKIQNLEKFADLTEKCTKRLSDLAKVLEQVRRNKSTVYSQVSSTDTSSDVDQKLDKKIKSRLIKPDSQMDIKSVNPKELEVVELKDTTNNTEFIPMLDIPKPPRLNRFVINEPHLTPSKSRSKPPPALSRANLKHDQVNIVPHELSTVPEVDSPMSLRYAKNQSQETRNNTKMYNQSLQSNGEDVVSAVSHENKPLQDNPDILRDNLSNIQKQSSFIDISEISKMQMMDLPKFNEIMLKPFVTLEEYAKQYNIGALDEGSNIEDILKDDVLNDEISSLHSDGSLPDVISELLKRNIITEPFRFDSMSNANSTTISTDSSLSMLALSKKKKDNLQNSLLKSKIKVGATDTSDTLSISSNPDLENEFKKLGIGWASSTLKKTKERLALSSTTSTSTSSTSQKVYGRKYERPLQNIPALISDSLSKELSDLKISLNKHSKKNMNKSKNVEQQTSMTNSMTVKDFLANELANKITFTSNSQVEDSEQYFTSMYSTKLPNESANIIEEVVENKSIEDIVQPASRQRTSTPVQLFKSLNYNTNSSSNNNSNGIFSAVDDLSSVKATSSSLKNNSNSDKDELSIPNYSLKSKKDKTDQSKSND